MCIERRKKQNKDKPEQKENSDLKRGNAENKKAPSLYSNF